MGQWKIVVPITTTNLIINPSIELIAGPWASGTAGWAVTRTRGGVFGPNALCARAAAAVAANIAVTSTAFTFPSAGSYVISAYAYYYAANASEAAAEDIYIGINTFTSSTQTVVTRITGAATTTVVRLKTLVTIDAGDLTGTIDIYATATGSGGEFVLDGIQAEAGTIATTYCDGDQPGCIWNGAAHASTSTRSVINDRSAGAEYDLEDTYSAYVLRQSGVGLPPMKHHTTGRALLPGAEFTGRKVQPRPVQLTVMFKGSSLANLHTLRKAFINAIKPDLTPGDQPFTLRYYGSSATAPTEMYCVYDAGLEYTDEEANVERLALRLIAYDPFAYSATTTTVALDGETALTNANRILARSAGIWGNMNQGVNDAVYALAVDPVSGYVYAGGTFTTAGSGPTTVNRVAYWNGTAWAAMGAGPGLNGDVKAIAIDAAGNVYLGGKFTDVGGSAGTAYNRVVKWNGSAYSALGTGMDSDVTALAIDNTGNLWAGGAFTTAGGGAALRVAKWDGSTWAAAGSGFASGSVLGLTIGKFDGYVYACGDFTASGAVTVNRVSVWNGTAWAAMSNGATAGVGAACNAILGTPDGTIYATGAFTTAGGVTVDNIAQWTGNQWKAVGSGLLALDTGNSLAYSDGILYIGASPAAGATLDGFVLWNGSSMVPADLDMPGTPTVAAIAVNGDKVYTGFSTTGTATVAGSTTVTNAGTTAAYPIISVYVTGGTCKLYSLRNETTGAKIFIDDYYVQDGETVTFDFTLGERTVTSSFMGNVAGSTIMRGSDLTEFNLIPGANQITALMIAAGGGTVTITATYKDTYWSVDS